MNKWDQSLRVFCIAKVNILINSKRETTNLDKIFANDSSSKGLISEYTKELALTTQY